MVESSKIRNLALGNLYSYLCTIFPDLFIHLFVKRKPEKSYEEDLMKNSNTVMIQVDFAENYTCAAQDEVHRKQIGNSETELDNFVYL